MNKTIILSLLACLLTGCNKAEQPVSKASAPNPVDGATGVSPDTQLSWTGEAGARYKVYFAAQPSPPFVGEQQVTTFDPGALEFDTTYYWRIDIVGRSQGQLWKFTTFWYGDPGAEEMDI